MHPSKYFAMNTNKGNLINPDIDPEEENNQYYDNQVFEQTADDFENRSSQYHKTIGKTLEEKLRECKPISNPDMAFGSLLPPGGNYYGSLGKRADGAHDEEGEGEEPFKVMVSESQPFGVLNENTLDDRRILPKHDKEKNIIITPKTKEEVEGTKKFFNDMLENLAKTHNMKVEDVLKFTLELKCDVFCFENIHQALLKAAENNDKINEGQTKQARITNNQIMPSPIR